jgi:adhesin transport system outer membrane protein
LTLKESVNKVLENNPVILEQYMKYKESKKDLDIVQSDFKPKVDLRSTASYNKTSNFNHNVADENYRNYTNVLTITQNLFNGFRSTNDKKYQENKLISSSYNYLKSADEKAYEIVESYVNAIKSIKILDISKEDIKVNKELQKKITKLCDEGIKVISDVHKINSSYALSRSNYLVKQLNLENILNKMQYLIAEDVDKSSLVEPKLSQSIPATLDEAISYALENNPSLNIANYNIEASKALANASKNTNYPIVDLKLSQTYNDVNTKNSFDAPNDDSKVMIELNYNLYNGGKDASIKQKNKILIQQAIQNQLELQREIKLNITNAYNSNLFIDKQLVDLNIYLENAIESLKLYKKEYKIGQKTLLDLLTVQYDVTNAKIQITIAKYNKLLAQYKVLNMMGVMTSNIIGDEQYKKRVGLDIK